MVQFVHAELYDYDIFSSLLPMILNLLQKIDIKALF